RVDRASSSSPPPLPGPPGHAGSTGRPGSGPPWSCSTQRHPDRRARHWYTYCLHSFSSYHVIGSLCSVTDQDAVLPIAPSASRRSPPPAQRPGGHGARGPPACSPPRTWDTEPHVAWTLAGMTGVSGPLRWLL